MTRALAIVVLLLAGFTAGAARRPWSADPIPDGCTRYVLPADRQVYIHVTTNEHFSVDYRSLFILDYPEQKTAEGFNSYQFYGAIPYTVPHARWWRQDEAAGYLMPVEVFQRLDDPAGKAWGPLPEETPVTDAREWARVARQRTEARNR